MKKATTKTSSSRASQIGEQNRTGMALALSYALPLALPASAHHAITSGITLTNIAGDQCEIEGHICHTTSDCSGNGLNNAGEPSTCECYFIPEGTAMAKKCEDSAVNSEIQHCTCHALKFGYQAECSSNFDCLSGHCDMGGIGDHGCTAP